MEFRVTLSLPIAACFDDAPFPVRPVLPCAATAA